MSTMSETLLPKTRSRRSTAGVKLRSDPRRETMNSLAKGLSVIRVFSRDRAALRLCDVAHLTSMPPATARRCLMALEDLGYVVHHGSLFYLRPKVLELTAAYLDSMDLEALTRKRLEILTQTTGDTSAVSVLDGTETVYVAHAEVRTQVRLELHVGSRFPAHATAGGRVLLADLSAAALNRYLQTPLVVVPNAPEPASETALRKAIGKGQRSGYSALVDELAWGIVSLAVPIHDRQGRVIAALCSSSQSSRVSLAQIVRERLELLKTLSGEITEDLSSAHSLSFAHLA
jgi:IclR family pca regulon transcriptional regulator